MRNAMEYKGYLGSIEYSQEDSVLFGKILGINDLVSYDGTSINEIVQAFEEAVEDYFETCKEIGKAPEKPYHGSLAGIEISPDLHRQVFAFAYDKNKEPSQLVEEVLSNFISQRA